MNLESYRGLETLTFGSSPPLARRELGLPMRDRRNSDSERELWYSGLILRYSESDHLVEITLVPKHLAVQSINGAVVEWKHSFLDRLCQIDGKPLTTRSGQVVLMDLGLVISGLDPMDGDSMSITAFARGHWDELLSRLEPRWANQKELGEDETLTDFD